MHGCRLQFSWSYPLENACRHLSASIPCPHSDRGPPGKARKFRGWTSGEPFKTLNRWRERNWIINLSLGFSNRNKSYLRKLAHARSPAKKFWETGKFRRCRKKSNEASVMFKENFNFWTILRASCKQLECHNFVTRGVLQASNVHFNRIRPNQCLNILPGSSCMCLF